MRALDPVRLGRVGQRVGQSIDRVGFGLRVEERQQLEVEPRILAGGARHEGRSVRRLPRHRGFEELRQAVPAFRRQARLPALGCGISHFILHRS